jgi:hypothetical protein
MKHEARSIGLQQCRHLARVFLFVHPRLFTLFNGEAIEFDWQKTLNRSRILLL